jgi:hypothetical protein
MTAKDAIRKLIQFCDQVTRGYVADLTDQDLLVRSVPNANHIAWQLGHLISGGQEMLKAIGHPAPRLPDGFATAHSPEAARSDDPAKFCKKAEYMRLWDEILAASLAAVDTTSDADLDKPAPEKMRPFAPTKGDVLAILGTHWLMHAGQFVPIRRKLGKAPLF